MRDFIAASGIGTAHVQTAAGLTVGLYLIPLENGERRFSYRRGQPAACATGKIIAFDPNLRPRLWPGTVRMTTVIMQGAACAAY